MSRTTATIPDDLDQLIEGSIRAGVFENKSDAIRHVLREYFEKNENARFAAAVNLYDMGKLSLGQAARLADVSRFEMRDILQEHDVDLRIGPKDMEEAKQDIDTALDLE